MATATVIQRFVDEAKDAIDTASTVQLQLDTADGAVALRTHDNGAHAVEPATAEPAATELSLEQRLVEHFTAASAPLTATAECTGTIIYRARITLNGRAPAHGAPAR